ncbi:16S rRNA (guanine(527)-N(7))-methyltransferase RsmG [Actinopolyspora erythraea]|uniref:Ribosomal RNA small subunit methyltransferase G n=1 Tax=Actinopolyspora erythraea TaxID=414996 RepID=A0A099DC37_9ACTN|nr:16S rRNA (guanine(527)-N(7))-methyltransferase RsmG [Actinopolyspora erythraea]KGI82955.1 16S rRNA methyltransferase [Actinopolyspora erythraea]
MSPERMIFGDRASLVREFAERLLTDGVRRGLIGPREGDRLWERHIYNSAVLHELLPREATVVDVGSGAGLPGIPLAIARPDLTVTLLEPMARRVAWLEELTDDLELPVTVVRGRAEDKAVRARLHDQDFVVARAVSSLERLAEWCLPLLRPGGWLLAQKGASAAEELERDRAAIVRRGGDSAEVRDCGADVLETPANVVVVRRSASTSRSAGSGKRARGGRTRRPDNRRSRKER